MSVAAKHLDPLIGLDVHIIQPAGPVPPLPIPHPHSGLILDPFDYVPVIGSTVKIGGLHRALGGTVGVMLPSHIPLGGMFVKPPSCDSEVFMGSSTVLGDREVMGYLALPSLSCWDVGMPPVPRLKKKAKRVSLCMPTTFMMSIPSGVNIGGAPTISLMGLAVRGAIHGLGALARRAKKAWIARRLRRQNGRCANGLDPVDLISGAVFDSFVDAKIGAFRWERHYSTAQATECGALGFGFRHGYQYELRVYRQGIEVRLPSGEAHFFLGTLDVGEVQILPGLSLRRLDPARYELVHGDRRIEFEPDGDELLRPQRVQSAEGEVRFERRNGRLERATTDHATIHFDYDPQGRIISLRCREDIVITTIAAYKYDAHGDLIETTDAVGGTSRFAYDSEHRWLVRRNPSGYRYAWRYDRAGRCIKGMGEDRAWRGTIEYRPHARETRVHQRGGTWIYKYDEYETITEITDPFGGVRVRKTDEQGRVVADIDSGGRVTTWLYDESGAHVANLDRFGHRLELDDDDAPNPLEVRMPERVAEWAFGGAHLAHPDRLHEDRAGRVIAATAVTGALRRAVRDHAGNVVRVVDRDERSIDVTSTRSNLPAAERDMNGGVTQFQYSESEQVTSIIDPGGTTSEYGYDAKDRLVAVRRHDRIRDEYVYDAGDRLVEKRGASGLLLSLKYNPQSLVEERRLASGEVQRFAYSVDGKVKRAATDGHEVELERSPGQEHWLDLRDGIGVRHQFESGNVVESRVLDRFAIRYETTRDGERIITDPAGRTCRIHRVNQGSYHRTLASGTREELRYDHEGRLVTVERQQPASATHAIRYEYSGEGDLLAVHDSRVGETRCTWDAAHRLLGVQGPTNVESFERDPAGNLLLTPTLRNVSYRDGNRLLHANDNTFEYDDRDHIARRVHANGRAIAYHYDALDQLVAVVDESCAGFWTARYDGLGRRVSSGFDNRQRTFYWDENRLAAEIAPNGGLRIYVYSDPESLIPIGFVDYDSVDADPDSGRSYSLFTNQVGMPTLVEDIAGNVVWRALRSDAYGYVEVDSAATTIELNLRWPGHYFDPDLELHYNRFRYYDPRLGRYLQSDPAGTEGGLNLYAYVADPVSNVDLLGLARCGDVLNSVWTRLGASRFAEGVRSALQRVRSWFRRAPRALPAPTRPPAPRRTAAEILAHGDAITWPQSDPRSLVKMLQEAPAEMRQELVERARASGHIGDVGVIGKDADVHFRSVLGEVRATGANPTSIEDLCQSQGIFQWNPPANLAWMDGVIETRKSVILTHPPEANGSFYSTEIEHFRAAGYTLDPSYSGPGWGRMVPPST